MVVQVQNDPIYNLPNLYLTGLNASSASNTTLSISGGQCRDSTDSIDIVVGSPNIGNMSVSAPLVLTATVNGINGLDTGALAASSVYAVYIIADSRYYKPTGAILSLASNAVPLLPTGYDSYRLICYCSTTSGSVFNPFVTVGSSTTKFVFLAPAVVLLSAGTSNTAAPLTNLANVLPALPNQIATMLVSYTDSATAGATVNFRTGGTTNNAAVVTAQVATIPETTHVQVLTGVVGGVPVIDYINSTTTGSTTVSMAYYYVFV